MEQYIESLVKTDSERLSPINNSDIARVLEISSIITNKLENIKYIRHIENIIQYYIDFLDNKKIYAYLDQHTDWFSTKEIEGIKELFNKLIINMYNLLSKKDFEIISNNSLADILGNGPYTYMSLIDKRIKGKSQLSIDNLVENIKNILSFISMYVKAIDLDENKLYDALSKENGYIENYSSYFKERINMNQEKCRIYPTGSNKLYYYAFFLSYEAGHIKYDNLEEELEKLDDNIIDKDKIRIDFPNLSTEKE